MFGGRSAAASEAVNKAMAIAESTLGKREEMHAGLFMDWIGLDWIELKLPVWDKSEI